MGTKKTDGLLPPVTEDDTILFAQRYPLRSISAVLVLAHRGGFFFIQLIYRVYIKAVSKHFSNARTFSS